MPIFTDYIRIFRANSATILCMKCNATQFSVSETAFDLHSVLGSLRRPPVLLCIGSDRVTGDCIGPLVGHMLTLRNAACEVVGTLESPVTALNLPDTVATLKRKYAGRKIIAVDSCVGESDEVGAIRVKKGSLRPGLACGKTLPKVGDVSITATVAAGKADNLYSVRLGLVYSLAARIAEAVDCALKCTVKCADA